MPDGSTHSGAMVQRVQNAMDAAGEKFNQTWESAWDKIENGQTVGERLEGIGDLIQGSGDLVSDSASAVNEFGPGIGEDMAEIGKKDGGNLGKAIGGIAGEMGEGAAEAAGEVGDAAGGLAGGLISDTGEAIKKGGQVLDHIEKGEFAQAAEKMSEIESPLDGIDEKVAEAVSEGAIGAAYELGEGLVETGREAIEARNDFNEYVDQKFEDAIDSLQEKCGEASDLQDPGMDADSDPSGDGSAPADPGPSDVDASGSEHAAAQNATQGG